MLNRLRSILAALVRRDRFENAMADEMRFHVEAYAEDLMRAGISRAEAMRRARLEFGSMEQVKEQARQARGLRLFDELRQDLRYAVRMMVQNPGLTSVAVLSLALGVGANTAIFSLMDAVMFRTLPVKDPHELFYLAHDPGPRANTSSNYPLFERYRTADVFSGLTAYWLSGFRVTSPRGVESVTGQFVSGNYHAVLGVRLARGRGFSSESDRTPGGSLIAVISDEYWAREFGRGPDVIGKTLTIRGRVVSIVGVTAPGFHGLVPGRRIDVTLPMSVMALDDPEFLDAHDGWLSLAIVGRLARGVSEPQALAAVDTLLQRYVLEPENRWVRERNPDALKSAALLPAGKGSGGLRRQYSTALRVLMGMVCLVLLIACANVANLLLARASVRAREVAVRMSIGAGRFRLVRQFLTESLLIAWCGGALGLLITVWGTGAILSLFRTGESPILLDATLNVRVLAFTTIVSILTGIGFGLVPAFRATRVDLTPALKETSGSLERQRRWALGKTLVVAQVALCVLVVSGAGLLVRSLRNLRTFDAGFQRAQVLLFNVDVGSAASPDQRSRVYVDLLERLRRRPGVRSVSYSTRSPIDFSEETRVIEVPGSSSTSVGASANVVTPDYFETFGIRLRRGRGFTAQDRLGAPRVALVSEAMARYYFGQSDPIGRTIVLGSDRAVLTVVGVVQDVRHRLRDAAAPKMVYTPLAQSERDLGLDGNEAPRVLTAEVRTVGDPGARALAASMRDEVRALSKDAMTSYIRTMEEQIDTSLVRERVLATLSAAFGLLALLLACVGLYGVMSYDVARRSRDIGIRMALGAARVTVLRQVLREAVVLAAAGTVIGLWAAIATTSIVRTFLFELSPRDPMTLAAAAAILLMTTLVAGYFPAHRAASVDPIRAIRTE